MLNSLPVEAMPVLHGLTACMSRPEHASSIVRSDSAHISGVHTCSSLGSAQVRAEL